MNRLTGFVRWGFLRRISADMDVLPAGYVPAGDVPVGHLPVGFVRAAFIRVACVCVAILAFSSPAAAQADPAIGIAPDAFTLTGEPVVLELTVTGAPPTTGFQAEVSYDPSVLAVLNVTLGEFLASTGRVVQPLGPNLDTPGRIFVGGIAAGQENPPPEGDGVLARIELGPIAEGTGEISVVSGSLVDADQNPLDVAVSGATYEASPAVEKAATEYSGRAATLAAAPPESLAEDYIAAVERDATAGTTDMGTAEPPSDPSPDAEPGTGDATEDGSPVWWVLAVTLALVVVGLWVLARRYRVD